MCRRHAGDGEGTPDQEAGLFKHSRGRHKFPQGETSSIFYIYRLFAEQEAHRRCYYLVPVNAQGLV